MGANRDLRGMKTAIQNGKLLLDKETVYIYIGYHPSLKSTLSINIEDWVLTN